MHCKGQPCPYSKSITHNNILILTHTYIILLYVILISARALTCYGGLCDWIYRPAPTLRGCGVAAGSEWYDQAHSPAIAACVYVTYATVSQ